MFTKLNPMILSYGLHPGGEIGLAQSIIRSSTLTTARSKAATLRGGSGSLRLLIIGDSNVAGAGSGTSGPFLYVGARSRNFSSRLSGIYKFAQGSLIGAQRVNAQNSFLTFDPRISWVDGSIFNANCLGGDCVTTPNGDVGTIVFTPTESFDRVEIVYLSFPGNSVGSVTADGEAVGTLNGDQALAARSSGVVSLSQRRSTLTIEASDGAGMPILGILTWRSDEPAVLVMQAGWAGGTMAHHVNSSSAITAGNMMGTFNPDLIIVNGLTGNDALLNTNTATWETNMRTLVSKFQATGASFAWITGLNMGLADPEDFPTAPAKSIELNAKIREVCEELNISILDMHDFWEPPTDHISQYYTFDNVHMNYDGNTTYAFEVSRYIEKLLAS